MTKEMIAIIAMINAAKYNIAQNYFKKFTANKYQSITSKIRVDDMASYFVTAGIVGRMDELPEIKVNGFGTLEVEPDIVGGTTPFTPTDLLEVKAGIPTYINGKTIPAKDRVKAKHVKILKSGIENRKEKMAAEIFLNGSTYDKGGKLVSFGLATASALDFTDKVASDLIEDLIVQYQSKYGIVPTVEVGRDVFNKVKNEARDVRQNINNVSVIANPSNPMEMALTINGRKISLLMDAIDTKGNTIDASKRITLYDTNRMATAYAGLSYGDIKSNATNIVATELLAGETRVSETIGSKGLWAKSAPLPVVVDVKTFIRYNATGL
jgi:tartrate dehydratase beta subunit/fumarate hydratase class I family protein